MDATIIVAIITLCSAIIPQTISTLLKNKHELALKKFETFNLAKQDAILNFASAIANCMGDGSGLTTKQVQEYFKSLYSLLVYFPQLDSSLIDSLTSSIYDSDRSIENFANPVIKQLSKLLVETNKIK